MVTFSGDVLCQRRLNDLYAFRRVLRRLVGWLRGWCGWRCTDARDNGQHIGQEVAHGRDDEASRVPNELARLLERSRVLEHRRWFCARLCGRRRRQRRMMTRVHVALLEQRVQRLEYLARLVRR